MVCAADVVRCDLFSGQQMDKGKRKTFIFLQMLCLMVTTIESMEKEEGGRDCWKDGAFLLCS